MDFENEVMRSLGRIEEKVDGQKERIDDLEEYNENQEFRNWVKVAVVIPVVTVLHAALNKIGVKV
jgi:hypothetical protein